MEEENWFFRLSAFEDRLLAYYDEHPGFVMPETKRNEAYSFVKGGLRDISITRTSIAWGEPVPWDEKHVFYVWYDALINYLTAIGYGREDDVVEDWWPYSHHLIGKEIIRFHCVWWPAMCMAAGLEPPSHVQVHGWLLVGGQKLSKTMAREGGVKLTDIAPVVLTNEFGVDPDPLLLASRSGPWQRRRVLSRGDHCALQHGPREQPWKPGGASSNRRGFQVLRDRTGPAQRFTRFERVPNRRFETPPRRGTDSPPKALWKRLGFSHRSHQLVS